MLKNKRTEMLAALVLVAPFVIVYAVLFIYPSLKMIQISFTDAPLIGSGHWVGWKNYLKLLSDKLFHTAVWNTSYFVLLTVIPSTLVTLLIAMMVSRLKGWMQSFILVLFFLPFVLPVSVVYIIWNWILDFQFGIGQFLLEIVPGYRVPVFRSIPWFLPAVALVTVWWTGGFNILVFLAGLKNIPPELYESAALDGAGRWRQFRSITWPLIWPVTALVLTIQLILQLKIFDQVYLFSVGGRTDPTMVLVQYIYKQAFVLNHGGYGATVAVALYVIVVVFSVVQFQLLRLRRER